MQNLICQKNIQFVKMKRKVFIMIFQGNSVARNYPAPSTIMGIKRGLLCNFAKNFKGRHFMGHSGTDFQLLLNSKSSKHPLIVF